MSNRLYDDAMALFERALDEPHDRRRDFVERECRGNRQLAEHVLALLAADESPDPLLEATPAELGAAVSPAAAPTMVGRQFGPYRVVRELGRGGMGVVYLASRDDIPRDVALKLVPAGLAAPERIHRFLVERRLLARLQHPHIARLLDAGVDADGTPWFAMEYVEGKRIDQDAESRALTVHDRLRMFVKVCDAVAYAHHNLIVHRDIKPSNILVTPAGEPRLLDFGIAKLLEDDGGEEPTVTVAGRQPMTPEYAAPEQIRGDLVTPATDVYQLGLLLKALLTRKTVHEADHAPPLRGDLGTILSKALQPEPEARFASAQQLSDDLKRFLAGLPVTARPASVGYRFRKLVARHKVAAAATAAAVFALLTFTLALGVQARRLAQERDRVGVEAAKAAQVATFLTDLFTAADPARALGRDVTARELLAEGARKLGTDSALAAQPLVRASLLHVLGRVYRELGMRVEARPLLEEALSIRRATLDRTHPDLTESLNSLGVLAHAEGKYDEARSLFEESLAAQRSFSGTPNPATLAATIHSLAGVHLATGALDTAAALLREAIAIRRPLGDGEASALAGSLEGLGVVFNRKGEFERADSVQREALALRRAQLDPRHPAIANTLNNLGATRLRMGDAAAAETYFREALSIGRAVLGRHLDVATTLNNLGSSLERQSRLDEAEHAYRESLELKRALISGDHPTVAIGLTNLGLLLRKRGLLQEAGKLLLESHDMHARLRGADHPAVAQAAHTLADLHMRQGDYARAAQRFSEALRIRRQRLGDTAAATRASAAALAEARQRLALSPP